MNKQNITKIGPSLLQAAVTAHKAGNIKKAELLYNKTIDCGFSHEIAFSNLGVIYKNTGRIKEAISIYNRAISFNPDFADAYLNLGNLLHSIGKHDQALVRMLRYLEIKPNNPDALVNLGSIYKDLGNLDQALASTVKSLEINPDNPIAYINLSSIYKDLGKLDQALASILKSLEIKPDNPDAYINLGVIYNSLDKINESIFSLLKALQLKPSNITAHNNLTSILQRPRESLIPNTDNIIETIDIKLRNLKTPNMLEKSLDEKDIDKFLNEAFCIAKPIEKVLTTSKTQVFYRTKTTGPNCEKLTKFFESHNSIASSCHSCYKVQIEVNSLVELITLNFLMKSMSLKSDNTRKCMVELRKHASGFFKGLIYCTEIDEARQIAKEVESFIRERAKLNPAISVKRGCTEFTNKYKEYGEIGNFESLHQGPAQRREWEIKEKSHFSPEDRLIRLKTNGVEFNLGELLIIKNWIFYAKAMGDSVAISKYKNLRGENTIVADLINQKKSAIAAPNA